MRAKVQIRDKSCVSCGSQGYAPDNKRNYKDVRYYDFIFGPGDGNKTRLSLCETCVGRFIREYEAIKGD